MKSIYQIDSVNLRAEIQACSRLASRGLLFRFDGSHYSRSGASMFGQYQCPHWLDDSILKRA
jgi:hypothetical protein